MGLYNLTVHLGTGNLNQYRKFDLKMQIWHHHIFLFDFLFKIDNITISEGENLNEAGKFGKEFYLTGKEKRAKNR